ncbi:SH3 domain-containing protein [Minwuia thermotolerans]|uniref:SH3 domain-containing protein n=1 Tax=Minwuia thermotolerans TaxID=2056226 RepID=UPI0013DDD932|nr:SH3 domain-containing protein [Minwuia thermotolerans]
MLRVRFAFLLLVGLLPVAAPAAETGSETGLSLPRFVSVKADRANLRAGPGTDYPVRWVYRREHLPVQIVDEWGHWRAVRDPWGGEGWLHKSLLSGRRTAMVMQDLTPLKREPSPAAEIVLYAERRIIGTLELCRAGWCRLSIDGRAGWMPAAAIYGGENEGEAAGGVRE